MSDIDIWKFDAEDEWADVRWSDGLVQKEGPRPRESLTDGEELEAVVRIIELLDNLNNGEAIVITKEAY